MPTKVSPVPLNTIMLRKNTPKKNIPQDIWQMALLLLALSAGFA